MEVPEVLLDVPKNFRKLYELPLELLVIGPDLRKDGLFGGGFERLRFHGEVGWIVFCAARFPRIIAMTAARGNGTAEFQSEK